MFAVRVVHAPATLLAVPPRAATVGFDSSLTHAVASYTFRAGSGPYPVCGYAGGATYLVGRRSDGTWAIVRALLKWVT